MAGQPVEGPIPLRALSIVLPAAACLAVAACDMGPSPMVAGNWSSPWVKLATVQMQLQQDGDRVSGVACGIDSGYLVFSGAPVSGTLPDIRFQVPAAAARCCPSLVGRVFAGKLEEDRAQIAGEFGGTPLRFSHAAAAGCEGAQPPP